MVDDWVSSWVAWWVDGKVYRRAALLDYGLAGLKAVLMVVVKVVQMVEKMAVLTVELMDAW